MGSSHWQEIDTTTQVYLKMRQSMSQVYAAAFEEIHYELYRNELRGVWVNNPNVLGQHAKITFLVSCAHSYIFM